MGFEAPAQQKTASGNSLCPAVAAANASADASAVAREKENAWKDCAGDTRSACVDSANTKYRRATFVTPRGKRKESECKARWVTGNTHLELSQGIVELVLRPCNDGNVGPSLYENLCERESEALTTACNVDVLA